MTRRILLSLLLLFCTHALAESKSPMPLQLDGIHDRESPAFHLLQEPEEGLGLLPRRPNGEVDWVSALRSGAIQPRADLHGESKLAVIDLDVLMTNTASLPPVRFSHKAHTQWLTCSNCHVGIFLPKAGANFVTMQNILDGQYCGVCHGTVVFDVQDCARCHNEAPLRRGLR